MPERGSLAEILARAGLVCCFAAALCAQPAGALAQQPPPIGVQSPRPKAAIEVPYPEGATGEQTVVLELTIDAGGNVRGMRIVEGSPPFSTAAMKAAAGAGFYPAERGGEPISARFLLRVLVAPPPAPPRAPGPRPRRRPPPGLPPKAPGKPAAPPAPGSAESAAEKDARAADEPGGPRPVTPIDVVVEGERQREPEERAPAAITRTSREIAHVPGAFGDAFRAVEVIPGVVPIASGIPYFFVRGATPASGGYFLDGIRVPFLFHFVAGPSVVNAALMDRIDFYPGAYPARYGRFIGGIVAASTTPPSPAPRAEVLVRAIDAGALVEVPLFDNRLSALASGRYAYAGPVLSLFAPETALRYWDYQFGAGYAVTSRDRFSVLAFGSNDFLGEVKPDPVTGEDKEREIFGTEFHRLDFRFDHARKGGPKVRVAATLGLDRSGFGDDGAVSSKMVAVRSDAEVPVLDALDLRAGTSLLVERYDVALPSAPEAKPPGEVVAENDDDDTVTGQFPARTAATFGAYLDASIRPRSFLELVPGLRVDLFGEEEDARVALDPRGAIRLKVLPMITSVSLVGLAHQRPAILVPVPGLDLPPSEQGLQEALHVSQGLEIALPVDVAASFTFFHHTYWDLTDASATCGSEIHHCKLSDRADGLAYGLEVLVQRPLTERVGGFIAYTLSRSERTALGETFPSDFDRTHVLHVALGYAFAPGWHAGARFTTYSGRPHSILAFDYPSDPTRPTQIGKTNAARLPAFYRLDLRLEKRWSIGRTGFISVVLEGLNVTLSEEVVDFDCQVADLSGNSAASSGVGCGRQTIGPITIPSIGIGAGF